MTDDEQAWWFDGVCYPDDEDEMVRAMMEDIRDERTRDLIDVYMDNTGEWDVGLALLRMIRDHITPEQFFKNLREEVVSWMRSDLSRKEQEEIYEMFDAVKDSVDATRYESDREEAQYLDRENGRGI